MKNRWCSYDATDPILVWELAAPAPTPVERRAVVEAVVNAGRDSGLLIVAGWPLREVSRSASSERSDEPLPYEDALFAGAPVPFSSRVFVREGPGGAIVEKESDDAGALLRSLESVDDGADDVWARRFAASHPFVGAFSTSSDKSVAVSVCFFATLFFDEGDPELLAKNQPRLLAFRGALLALARSRGGKLVAPTSTRPTHPTRPG